MKLFSSKKTLALSMMAATLIASLSAFTIVNATSVFAEETEPTATGIAAVNVSLSEDIVVKLHTDAVAEDGNKVVVSYGGKNTELTTHVNGVFYFTDVTPQNLNDVLTATMYDANDAQVGDSATFSVQSYLESLLALDYENSGCSSKIRYTAMKELAVNMLNYGAAAQDYTNHDEENLANKNLTEEQKALATAPITVSATDKNAVGDMWVGAGVRFDYKLGLYYVFQADSLDGITATIEGVEVTPQPYGTQGNQYVIHYNAFSATNMNNVITAKLSQEGKEDQTFAYSVKSYVAAKGNDGSALANLVNATYAYGYSAVAYSAEYILEDPTFEKAGSLTMDSNGYDFTDSKYGSVVLPALNVTDYTTSSAKSGSDANPTVTTTYQLNNEMHDYSVKVTSDDMIQINDATYSRYELSKVDVAGVTVTYDVATGYTISGTDDAALTFVRVWGADLVLVGDLTLNFTGTYGLQTNNNLIIGTETQVANVTVNNESTSGSATGISLWDKADLTVAANSTVTIVKATSHAIRVDKADSHININGKVCIQSASTYGIYLEEDTQSLTVAEGGELEITAGTWGILSNNAPITVDGKLTSNTKVYVYGAPIESADYEYGFKPTLFIRKGTADITGQIVTNSLQVGSEKDGYFGTLNLIATVTTLANSTFSTEKAENCINRAHGDENVYYAFDSGSVTITRNGSGSCAIDPRVVGTEEKPVTAYLLFGSNVTVTVINGTKNITNFVGYWSSNEYSTYRYNVHDSAKFNFTASSTTTYMFNMGAKVAHSYVTYYTTTTMEIGGESKSVYVANQVYDNTGLDYAQATLLTVENEDGTKSIAPVVAEGTVLAPSAEETPATIDVGVLGTFTATTTEGLYYKALN